MLISWLKANKLLFVVIVPIIILNILLFVKFSEWIALSNILIIILYLNENYKYFKFKNFTALYQLQDSMKDLEEKLGDLFKFDDKDHDKKD